MHKHGKRCNTNCVQLICQSEVPSAKAVKGISMKIDPENVFDILSEILKYKRIENSHEITIFKHLNAC